MWQQSKRIVITTNAQSNFYLSPAHYRYSSPQNKEKSTADFWNTTNTHSFFSCLHSRSPACTKTLESASTSGYTCAVLYTRSICRPIFGNAVPILTRQTPHLAPRSNGRRRLDRTSRHAHNRVPAPQEGGKGLTLVPGGTEHSTSWGSTAPGKVVDRVTRPMLQRINIHSHLRTNTTKALSTALRSTSRATLPTQSATTPRFWEDGSAANVAEVIESTDLKERNI